jgi:hypothetical protein
MLKRIADGPVPNSVLYREVFDKYGMTPYACRWTLKRLGAVSVILAGVKGNDRWAVRLPEGWSKECIRADKRWKDGTQTKKKRGPKAKSLFNSEVWDDVAAMKQDLAKKIAEVDVFLGKYVRPHREVEYDDNWRAR